MRKRRGKLDVLVTGKLKLFIFFFFFFNYKPGSRCRPKCSKTKPNRSGGFLSGVPAPQSGAP